MMNEVTYSYDLIVCIIDRCIVNIMIDDYTRYLDYE